MVTPRLIADYACATGEGPFWHEAEQKLYWCDIPTGKLFRYDPKTDTHELYWQAENDVIGGFTVQQDGSIALFMNHGAARVLRDGQLETVLDAIEREKPSRFNDVIADPKGRVFCGTMSTGAQAGALYRLDPDESIRVVVENVGTSNGLGFTPDGKGLYYTDSKTREIYLYDYDQATGKLDNRRVFVSLSEDDLGVPDGMTVDAEGFVWSARWDGGCLVRYAPDGKEDMRITFPAKKVSSVTFGGPDYTDMYITTAGGQDKPNEGTGAGALFHVNLGIKGVPEFTSALRVS